MFFTTPLHRLVHILTSSSGSLRKRSFPQIAVAPSLPKFLLSSDLCTYLCTESVVSALNVELIVCQVYSLKQVYFESAGQFGTVENDPSDAGLFTEFRMW